MSIHEAIVVEKNGCVMRVVYSLSTPKEAPKASVHALKGVMRVGVLAKGLLLHHVSYVSPQRPEGDPAPHSARSEGSDACRCSSQGSATSQRPERPSGSALLRQADANVAGTRR